MRISLVVLSVVATALAVPSGAPAQLPQLPEAPKLPPVPSLPQVPKLPPAPAPLPAVPTVAPAPALSDSPQLPVPQPAPPSPPVPPPAAAPTPAPAQAPASAAPAPAGAGGPSGTTTATAPDASRAIRAGRTATDRGRAERRLRRAVKRLDACLDELPAVERRVLALRTGLGPARPRSRRSVADTLEVGVGRVHRLERRGLRQARRLSRARACGGSSDAAVSPQAPDGRPPAGGTGDGSRPAIAEAPAERRIRLVSERDAASGGRGPGAAQPAGTIRIPLIGDVSAGTPIAIGLGLMFLAAVAGFGTPHLRDRLH